MVNTSAIAGLLFFTAALTAGLAVLAFRYRSEPGAEWFTGVAAIGALLIVMDTLQLVGSTWLVLFVVEWAGTVLYITVPVVWFCFILSYVGYGELLTWKRRLLLFSVPAVSTLSLATMQYNDLYWTFEISRQAGRVTFVTEPGPLAFLALLYSYTLFVAGLALVVGMLRRGGTLFSGQAVWILVGTVAPMIGGLLTAFGPDLEQVLPPFPIGLSVFTLAFGYGLLRHRIFDLTPATRTLGTTTAVQSLNEGIIVLNTDGTVVSINDGACQLFDCDRGAILGASIEEVHPELQGIEDRPQPVDIIDDGFSFEVTTSTVDGVRGREIGQAVVVRDVTAQRDRKQRLSVLNRVLRHNLRNDMMVVQAFARAISDDGGPEVAAHAEKILHKTDKLVDQAEKARKIETHFDEVDPPIETMPVEVFVEGVVESVQSETESVPIEVDVPTGALATVDTTTLELVTSTLLENAIKHGTPDANDPHGGEPPVRFSASVVDDTLSVTIADDGPGIPSEEYAVLDQGEETKLDHGSGVGLWLAKWGTDRLNGSLSFHVEGGTAVTMDVPLAENDSSDVTELTEPE
jgi:signal transduction histidine kinase